MFAGLMPLALFIWAGAVTNEVDVTLPAAHPHVSNNALEAHLLIFTIANSTVSVLSSLFRMSRLTGARSEAANAPKYLFAFSVGVLVMSSGAYVVLETGTDGMAMTISATALMAASIVPSFFIELALARILIASLPQKRSARKSSPESPNDESGAPQTA